MIKQYIQGFMLWSQIVTLYVVNALRFLERGMKGERKEKRGISCQLVRKLMVNVKLLATECSLKSLKIIHPASPAPRLRKGQILDSDHAFPTTCRLHSLATPALQSPSCPHRSDHGPALQRHRQSRSVPFRLVPTARGPTQPAPHWAPI